MITGFQDEHAKWLDSHLSRRKGERKSRLERGHGHGERMFAERIWWELFGHFNDLHPEYEVKDFRGRPYFLDFAWKPGRYRFSIDVKGFGPHVQNMDRVGYRRELNREIYLQNIGYRIINIPYDDLAEQPQLTISLLKPLLLPYATAQSATEQYTRLEREALLIAMKTGRHLRPADLVTELVINRRTAVNCLKSLCAKGRFRPIKSGNSNQVNRYEYIHSVTDQLLF